MTMHDSRAESDIQTAAPAARRWRGPAAIAGAAALVAAALLAVQMVPDGGSTPAKSPTGASSAADPDTTTGTSTSNTSRVMAYDLRMLVEGAPRVVVGTVSDVKTGTQAEEDGGMAYALATVKVADTLKGKAQNEITAFDYVYGDNAVAAGAPLGASFVEGQRVLLFLSSSKGTVHEDLGPAHWQVEGGAQGLYVMKGGEPDADFTLAEVEAEIARQKS